MSNTNKYCSICESLCPNDVLKTIEKNQVFLAYSSHEKDIVDDIERARILLKKHTSIDWISWDKDMDIDNRFIFCEICENIYTSKAILTEMSDLNFNVIFEYGYSLGINKKILPLVNSKFDFRNIDRFFKPFLGVGIGKYDHNKLYKKVEKKKFWNKERSKTIFDFSENDILSDDTKILSNKLLYIRNSNSQDVAEKIEDELGNFNIDIILDDPNEDNYNLTWYVKQIKKSYAVVIDMGMSSYEDNYRHFIKCALVAGISIATGRRVLIMSSIHADKPSDVISIIKQYTNAKIAASKVHKFMSNISNEFSIINSYVSTYHHNKPNSLRGINLGEHVAENDIDFLSDCFVELPEFNKILSNGYKLILGRKGLGKSAAFLKLRIEAKADSTIRIYKYLDKYNLNDLYDLISNFNNKNDQDKISVAYWKYIIFSIIAKEIMHDIETVESASSRKIGDVSNHHHIDSFIQFINASPELLNENTITDNLVEIIEDIKSKGFTTARQIQSRFYADKIVDLQNHVLCYINNMEKRLDLNIDGLDSNISIRTDNELTSLILYNLHEVCSTLFQYRLKEFSINVFLRTDLYNTFKDNITEKDKVNKVYFKWSIEQLMQMINQRLQKNGINHVADILSEDLTIFHLNKRIKKYVYDRPRDCLLMFSFMLDESFNTINNKSFQSSLISYAKYVNESLEAEFLSSPTPVSLPDLMSNIKIYNNESDTIPVSFLFKIFSAISVEQAMHVPLLKFLLELEFCYIKENNEKVIWENLINPSSKINAFLHKKRGKNMIYFHPIINFLVSKSY